MKAQDREIIETASGEALILKATPEATPKSSLNAPKVISEKEELHIVKELQYNLMQLEDLQNRFRFVMGEIRSALKVK